jgi:hypothetical protein
VSAGEAFVFDTQVNPVYIELTPLNLSLLPLIA